MITLGQIIETMNTNGYNAVYDRMIYEIQMFLIDNTHTVEIFDTTYSDLRNIKTHARLYQKIGISIANDGRIYVSFCGDAEDITCLGNVFVNSQKR